MSKLYGIPTDDLALALAVMLLVAGVAVSVLAIRNRVFVRLGVRNVRRRPGRSALIVVGSMLGTAIIAAALATGDTMSLTIRSAASDALGRTDEVVAVKGVDAEIASATSSTGARYFPQSYSTALARAAAGRGLVSGVAPVIMEDVAVQDIRARQNEPRVTLFATQPASLRGFGDIRSGGKVVSLADLRPGEIYLNEKAADALDARAGDRLRLLVGRASATVRVRSVVEFAGGATPDQGLLMRLDQAQRLVGKQGLVKAIFIANAGGVGATDRVIHALGPTVRSLGLQIDDTKRNALELADEQGAAFMSMFTTFGSFSIAAGVLLIFLIFVMLAAERRGELGIARAVGTRRGHLVQMFLYEGIAYDVIAAVVGAIAGIGLAYLMVLVIGSAFGSSLDFSISYGVKGTSILIAYGIGVLLTLAVVGFSAWRVSRMNIATAIRNLPEPPSDRGRRRWIAGIVGVLVGAAIGISGIGAKDAVTLGFGVLLVVLGLVPILRALGVRDRLVYTGAGAVLVMWFVLPLNRWLFGEMKTNFSMFILGGLAIVIGASWMIVYNADVLLGALAGSVGRLRSVAPVLRMSIAYPLRSLFRTGVTLAMFTLVVFTLVVGAITTGSFVNAFNDIATFGGGFDVTATTSAAAPITDMRSALARSPDLAKVVRVASSQSSLPVKARQADSADKEANYSVHGVDAAFLNHTTYRFSTIANGYRSPEAVWQALRDRPNLAVVDASVAPRKSNYNFAPPPDFRLHGFYVEDKTFAPVKVFVRDPQTRKRIELTVIGVLADSTPLTMTGIWTSQRTLSRAFGDRALPTSHLLALRSGADPRAVATRLESTFLANGMEADALEKVMSDTVAGNLTFDRLIMGFMGLGLLVGVAALGVISARSVVERRQQIGVLRAIGFRRKMVQAIFLFEASFIALTSIVVGTGLGLAVGHNVIADSQRLGTFQNLSFQVPWLTLAIIFLIVYVVAILTTIAPARRAARVFPAEALRYQ